MKGFASFNTKHADLIHDIAYDYYGERIATCSSDQTIKVWEPSQPSQSSLNQNNNNLPNNNLQANNNNNDWVLSNSWKAHIGSISRVCWAHPEFGQILASCSIDKTVLIWEEVEQENHQKTWQKLFHLADFRDAVADIAFCPKHLGLRLATASLDGYLRIYEAGDVTNLNQWTLIDEWESHKGGCNCLSWNKSWERQALIVGGNETAKIWEYGENRKWSNTETLSGYSQSITDVSWAPNLGRSYHLIATASKDRSVRIWKITNPESGSIFVEKASKIKATQIASFSAHGSEVWRVEWNITGTLLASSGDDGSVRLWKADAQGEWKALSKISGEVNK